MKTIASDTTPEAEEVLLELIRHAPVWKRLEMVDHMHETLRQLAIADIKRCHPDADDQEITHRLASRLLSRSEVVNAYGWDPELQGY